MLSPGFCSALPKQSSELASRILPGFRCATGGATPKTYFTLSIVAWYCTTSASAGAGADCAGAGSGKAAAKKNTAKQRRTGVLQTGRRSPTHSAGGVNARPLDRHRGHASAMLFREHEKRRRKRPQDRFACAERNYDFVCDRREKNACRGDQ